jgi:hypothetical protein
MLLIMQRFGTDLHRFILFYFFNAGEAKWLGILVFILSGGSPLISGLSQSPVEILSNRANNYRGS